MLTIKIAFRNIFRQKRRSLFTALTMIGGFVLAAFCFGIADGIYGDVIDMFTRNSIGHVQVHAPGYRQKESLYKTIGGYDSLFRKIDGVKEVEQFAPRLYASGLVSVREESNVAVIVGIEPELENRATNFNKKVITGKHLTRKAAHTVLLGKGLAKNLKASPGDTIVIVSQAADGSIANDMYTVTGIVESGNREFDRIVLYMHLQDAQELFVLYGQIHEIVVIGEKSSEAQALSKTLRTVLGSSYDVAPWQEIARTFYKSMKADIGGMYIMLVILLIVVAISILNTVLMAVLERQREYGILKAIGTRPTQILFLILYETGILALLSIGVSIVLSFIINYLFSLHGLQVPEPYYYGGMEFTHFRTVVNAKSFYIPALTIFGSALLVSIFPAIKAARTEPAATMRIH